MFEKKIKVLYVRTNNFINEKTGESVTGSKISYHFIEPTNQDNEKGYRVQIGNLSLDTGKKIMNKLPYECTGKFELSNDSKIKLVAISE